MKKRLVLLLVILTLLVGFNQKTFSGGRLNTVTNYMTILGPTCHSVGIAISIGNANVTIYNLQDRPVSSFSVPHGGIYEADLYGEPAGTYYAVLSRYGIYEVDYFTKDCN